MLRLFLYGYVMTVYGQYNEEVILGHNVIVPCMGTAFGEVTEEYTVHYWVDTELQVLFPKQGGAHWEVDIIIMRKKTKTKQWK